MLLGTTDNPLMSTGSASHNLNDGSKMEPDKSMIVESYHGFIRLHLGAVVEVMGCRSSRHKWIIKCIGTLEVITDTSSFEHSEAASWTLPNTYSII